MSLYRFSKGGRLFVQGTREDDNRDGVSPSPTGSRSADDLQAVYTKRRLSTEVLGSKSKSGDRRERIRSDDRAGKHLGSPGESGCFESDPRFARDRSRGADCRGVAMILRVLITN